MNVLVRFWVSEDGATAIEYAIIISLMILAIIAAFFNMGNSASDMWNDLATHIEGT